MSEPMLVLGRDDHGALITHDEFATAQYDEPWRYERADGRLVVRKPADHDVQVSRSALVHHLLAYRQRCPNVVEHVFIGAWVIIDENTERIADIGVYLKSSSGRIPERTPELIFEVVSDESPERQRTYHEKRLEYERIGIHEYVIIDPFEGSVSVFHLNKGRYQSEHLWALESYSTPLLPELAIPLIVAIPVLR
ncbi:MAG: Uma2 family endonuclease [Planctomycetaceae bacterium]